MYSTTIKWINTKWNRHQQQMNKTKTKPAQNTQNSKTPWQLWISAGQSLPQCGPWTCGHWSGRRSKWGRHRSFVGIWPVQSANPWQSSRWQHNPNQPLVQVVTQHQDWQHHTVLNPLPETSILKSVGARCGSGSELALALRLSFSFWTSKPKPSKAASS